MFNDIRKVSRRTEVGLKPDLRATDRRNEVREVKGWLLRWRVVLKAVVVLKSVDATDSLLWKERKR